MTRYFQNTEKIALVELSDGDVLVDLDGHRVAMSYDAVYDLALRLAYLIEKMDESEGLECQPVLN